MMRFRKPFILLFLAFCGLFTFSSCEKESVSSGSKLEVKITDAPVDDASIQGVFITVTEVKVDGQLYEGLDTRQTIDIYSYQNGQVKSLGIAGLDAGSYQQLSLTLDLEADASGQAPGCYILTKSGEKIDLARDFTQKAITLTVNKSFEVKEQATSSVVLDFDLRKAIKYQSSGSSNSFAFVGDTELKTALRAVEEEKTGSIKGDFEANSFTNSEKVIVYAYKKGTFNAQSESQAQSDGKAAFRNAVTSAVATENNGRYFYKLSFLEAGEYDIVLASYKDEGSDGSFEFEGFLQSSLSLTGSVTSPVTVQAGLEVGFTLSIIGIVN